MSIPWVYLEEPKGMNKETARISDSVTYIFIEICLNNCQLSSYCKSEKEKQFLSPLSYPWKIQTFFCEALCPFCVCVFNKKLFLVSTERYGQNKTISTLCLCVCPSVSQAVLLTVSYPSVCLSVLHFIFPSVFLSNKTNFYIEMKI